MISFPEPLWPEHYKVSKDHCRDTIQGSYDVPFDPPQPPVILDIGANIGAFTRWAVQRWPGCVIHCYEPHPGNFAMLEETVNPLRATNTIFTHQVAVGGVACRAFLHEGEFNCGEWSLFTADPKRSKIEVDVISAADLPKADILKLDVEAAEADILARLNHVGRLSEFQAIMLECHNANWIDPLKFRLDEAGFDLYAETYHGGHRTELKWIKKSSAK